MEFGYTGLVHRAGALFEEKQFDGDENAILDFKYCTSKKITWWFDHHQSAFLTAEDAAHYEQNPSTRKFYDPDYRSCTKFIATMTELRFGFNQEPVAEVVKWADIIDGALYENAKVAVEMKEPAMKLTMVIESTQDPTFIPRLIPLLATKSLDEILHEPFVAELLPPLLERHKKSIEIIKQRSECKEGTIYFDVTDQDLEGYNKFVPYYLASGKYLQCWFKPKQLPDQGFSRLESVDRHAGRKDGEPGKDLRALWWRRTCEGGGDLVRAQSL